MLPFININTQKDMINMFKMVNKPVSDCINHFEIKTFDKVPRFELLKKDEKTTTFKCVY